MKPIDHTIGQDEKLSELDAEVITKLLRDNLPEGYGFSLQVVQPETKEILMLCNYCRGCFYDIMQNILLTMMLEGTLKHGETFDGQKLPHEKLN